MPRLAFNYVSRLPQIGIRRAVSSQQFDGAQNRGERVAQFVREHGQKFILSPVGLFELLLGALTLGNLGLQRNRLLL